MKLWFWVKFTIAAFILFGVAGYYANSQTLKACQAKYSSTVDQLATAATTMSVISEPDRRLVVINLMSTVQHSYDLLAADPAHSAEALCSPQRLADLDAVTASLREGGYLPDHGERASVQVKLSDEALRDGIARFRVVFPPGIAPVPRSQNPAAREPELQKRPTSPRTNPGVQPPT